MNRKEAEEMLTLNRDKVDNRTQSCAKLRVVPKSEIMDCGVE